MAVLETRNPTLSDYIQVFNGNDTVAEIIEILTEKHDELQDMVTIEANGLHDHLTTIRTGIPKGVFRKLYNGTPPEKATTMTVRDSMGELVARAEIDQKLLELNGRKSEWLRQEEAAFVEGMGQTLAETLWYGNTSINPERFMGLSPRYSELSAENGRNIVNAGGTGADNASIWLVSWGKNKIHGIFPKGSTAGLHKHDYGDNVRVHDKDGNVFDAHASRFTWNGGLCVADWRYAVRIANIDVKKLNEDMSNGSANLPQLMARALRLIQDLSGQTMFYMNRDVRMALDAQIQQASKYTLVDKDVGGKIISHFGGVPIRTTDALLSTEAHVK